MNYGKNKELIEKCKRLDEYAKLIHTIREFQKQLGNIKKAVDAAIDFCIQNSILSEFLRRYRSMVTSMILTQYNEQKHIENEKRWSYEEGKKLISNLMLKLIQEGKNAELQRALVDDIYQLELLKEYNLL